MEKIWDKLRFWFNNARPVALPQSLLPALLALALAASEQPASFNLLLGLLAVLGAELAHLSLNLFDDYFDYRKLQSGFRDRLAAAGQKVRTGKTPYLTSGQANVGQLLAACLFFGAAACLCGLPVLICRGWGILWLVGAGLLLGLFYSAPPLRLSYHGLGDVVIGIVFGPLLMFGVYLAACGTLSFMIWPLAIAMGLLVANIGYVHSLLDVAPDRYAAKKTLADLLPTADAKRWACFVLTFGPFAIIEVLTIFQVISSAWLLPLLSMPLAAACYASVKVWLRNPRSSFPRLWWFGPMGNWQGICERKLDWFMVRWYLARNLSVAFALCCLLAAYISRA